MILPLSQEIFGYIWRHFYCDDFMTLGKGKRRAKDGSVPRLQWRKAKFPTKYPTISPALHRKELSSKNVSSAKVRNLDQMQPQNS